MQTPRLRRGRSLAANVVWNLLGQGAPLVVAVVAIPPLVAALGNDRFGLLSLAWVLIGYFSIFDLGIGRALTQIIASTTEQSGDDRLGRLVWTSLSLLVALGATLALALAAGAPWALHHLIKTPASLQAEAVSASYLVAAALPFGVTTTGLRGILEARQAFFASNLIRLPLGIFTYLAPLAVLPFTNHVDVICGALLVTRVLAFAGYGLACYRIAPELLRSPSLTQFAVRRLISFSGWMAVTNVVAPLMTYLDRFVIGSVVSISAVTFYAVPFDVVTRFLIVPAGVTGVMFPAFASLYSMDRTEARRLFVRSVRYLSVLMFPITLVLVTLAAPGLRIWLGVSFVERSTPVLQWLAVGLFINALGQVAFVLVQGAGRPRLTGLLNLAELPVYLVGLFVLVHVAGILGAAIAWTARAGLDAVVLFVVASRLLNLKLAVRGWRIPVAMAGAVLVLVGVLPMPFLAKLAYLAVVAGVGIPLLWRAFLSEADWARLIQALSRAEPSQDRNEHAVPLSRPAMTEESPVVDVGERHEQHP